VDFFFMVEIHWSARFLPETANAINTFISYAGHGSADLALKNPPARP